jgi:ATP-dependent exoDNAse (exonuclease V) beta subunit
VIERIVDGFEVDRESDSTIAVPAPLPRRGLKATFEPVELAVRVSLPSPARAAELAQRHREPDESLSLGRGPAPLVKRRPPAVPRRPLSYSAMSAYGECAYRFYMERVLGLGGKRRDGGDDGPATGSAREERAAHGTAVHALLEWSQANGWREPDRELARRHALAAGLGAEGELEELIAPVRGWLDSELCRTRVATPGAGVQAEVPILLGIGGTVLRGSIDLLVVRPGAPPLVVDYKTDRLADSSPAAHAAHYEIQRTVYALAVSESQQAAEVEVAYVFLERPQAPVCSVFGRDEIEAARDRLNEAIEQIGAGKFPAAERERRSRALCRGCPALGRMCAGPDAER